ncbi:MAG: bla regulator protein BlaR1 [Paraglaciecola sp.]|jgi:bla regulator protein BlaR1
MMIEYTLLTTLAFHHLVIGSLLIAMLWLLNRFVPSSAELRSWLWMTAFVISTIVPFSLITSEQEKTVTTISTSDSRNSLVSGEPLIPENSPLLVSPEQYWHFPANVVFSFSYFLTFALLIWLMGSLWRAYSSLKTILRTRQLMTATLTRMPQLSAYIGVDVYSSTKVSSPLVIGFLKPKVILPKSITEQLPDQQLKAIVLHEHAHIQRKDNWFGLFQELLAILFWWSPVIRILNKQIHVEREISCDVRAATKLDNGKQYAQSLLDCAKLMVNEQRNVLGMGLFSKKKELSHRVGAVLSYKAFKKPHAAVIVLLCMGLSISTIQAAQSFSPKISIKHTIADARHYSLLSYDEGSQLINAVMRNDIDAIKVLQDEGVDINTPALGDGTALMIAVKTNNANMVEGLLTLGADVDQSSEGDGNPLIVAAMHNNVEMAELLLNYGADVNAVVPRDESALINASRLAFFDMTRLLIERGADVNLAVTTGMSDGSELRSPLNQAASAEIQALLIANGAIK